MAEMSSGVWEISQKRLCFLIVHLLKAIDNQFWNILVKTSKTCKWKAMAAFQKQSRHFGAFVTVDGAWESMKCDSAGTNHGAMRTACGSLISVNFSGT